MSSRSAAVWLSSSAFTPARLSLLAVALAGVLFPGANAFAEACPDALAPGASAVDSDVDCDSRVKALARVVGSSVSSGAPFPSPSDGSVIGERSIVCASTLTNATLGADARITGATLGQFELPVTLGPGAAVAPRARLLATDIGANARIGSGARVGGGRGIDFQTIGDDLVVGAGADIGIRSLGNGPMLGEGAIVEAGAVVPDGIVVPAFHRVDVAGGITPIAP